MIAITDIQKNVVTKIMAKRYSFEYYIKSFNIF